MGSILSPCPICSMKSCFPVGLLIFVPDHCRNDHPGAGRPGDSPAANATGNRFGAFGGRGTTSNNEGKLNHQIPYCVQFLLNAHVWH